MYLILFRGFFFLFLVVVPNAVFVFAFPSAYINFSSSSSSISSSRNAIMNSHSIITTGNQIPCAFQTTATTITASPTSTITTARQQRFNIFTRRYMSSSSDNPKAVTDANTDTDFPSATTFRTETISNTQSTTNNNNNNNNNDININIHHTNNVKPRASSSSSSYTPNKPPKRVTLRRYLHNIVKADPSLRDLESLSLSIQMACKTISNLVSRAGINSSSGSFSGSVSGSVSGSSNSGYNQDSMEQQQEEEEERDAGLIQYDYRMNSMKRLDQLSTIVLRNALRFTGKLQSVQKAKDDDDNVSNHNDGNVEDDNDDDEDEQEQQDEGQVGRGGNRNDRNLGSEHHQPGVLIASTLDSKYVAIFDPLDGSGNADAAICTGTVFGIFQTGGEQDGEVEEEEGIDNVVVGGGDGVLSTSDNPSSNILINSVLQPGKKLVAAGYCLYSSSTILIFTLGEGTHGFTLDPQINEFVLTHPNIKIPPRGNVYSCNEANSEGWSDDVKRYLHALKSGENETKERYALRYVGSMVGDIHRTLMYGGIFFYPADSKMHPRGHLQLLYKSAPLSFVIQQAGGKSTNGKVDLLGVTPTRVHETSPCFIGSPEDIEEMKTFVMHE